MIKLARFFISIIHPSRSPPEPDRAKEDRKEHKNEEDDKDFKKGQHHPPHDPTGAFGEKVYFFTRTGGQGSTNVGWEIDIDENWVRGRVIPFLHVWSSFPPF